MFSTIFSIKRARYSGAITLPQKGKGFREVVPEKGREGRVREGRKARKRVLLESHGSVAGEKLHNYL